MVGLENCLHMGQVADFVWIFSEGVWLFMKQCEGVNVF